VLPGYISQATPIGIVDYQPNNRALDAAKTINHAFLYKRHSLHDYPLHIRMIMGYLIIMRI
jgi:adenylate cyclase